MGIPTDRPIIKPILLSSELDSSTDTPLETTLDDPTENPPIVGAELREDDKEDEAVETSAASEPELVEESAVPSRILEPSLILVNVILSTYSLWKFMEVRIQITS